MAIERRPHPAPGKLGRQTDIQTDRQTDGQTDALTWIFDALTWIFDAVTWIFDALTLADPIGFPTDNPAVTVS